MALAARHPVSPAWTLLAFVGWTAAIAWRFALWPLVLTAALPLANFAPWTGWAVAEEFDLLVLGAAAGGYLHAALTSRMRALDRDDRGLRFFTVAALVFGAASLVALTRGTLAADGATLHGLHVDAFESGRIFKSVAAAGLLWPLLREAARADADGTARRLAAGMLTGLTVVVLAVLWERMAYPGFWDFFDRYRTTALFWEMHVGGAAIDAYLALASPFVAWWLWSARSWSSWCGAAALAIAAAYACLTTYSRGVYLAVAISLLGLGLLIARRAPDGWRQQALQAAIGGAIVLGSAVMVTWAYALYGLAGCAAATAVLIALASPLQRSIAWLSPRRLAALGLALALTLEVMGVLGLGGFMRERAESSEADLGHRLEHWRRGVGFLDGPGDWIWGIGLGRLPARFGEDSSDSEFPGGVRWLPGDSGRGWVELRGPATSSDLGGVLALSQRVALRGGVAYRASLHLRVVADSRLSVSVCEIHLLYPRSCQSRLLTLRASDGRFRRVQANLRGPALTTGTWFAPRLAVLSIAVLDVGGIVELDAVGLRAGDEVEPAVGLRAGVEAELLRNRDFSKGLDHWYPVAHGYYLPWHIDNLFLEVLVERGLPALLALVVAVAIALRRLLKAQPDITPLAPFFASSLLGVLMLAGVSSVMDVPRVAFAFFLITLAAVELTANRVGKDLRGLNARVSDARPAAETASARCSTA